MFFSSFVALCLASTVLGAPSKRFDGLTVDLSAPASSVSSIDDLKFTATVKNTGSEDVKILKYGTILDSKLPTKSFTVKKDGAVVPFMGVKLSVSLTDLDDSSFVVIPAGKTMSVDHDVASLFDFASVGKGTFSFEPITSFKVMGANEAVKGAASFSKISPSTSKVEVTVTGDIAKRSFSGLNKRSKNTCTDATKKAFIDGSYTEGKALASGAVAFINSKGDTDPLYKSYWGALPKEKVTAVLSAVAAENDAARTLNCDDPEKACEGGVIAYTITATTNVYFCSIFFEEVPSTNLCSGTTVASRNIRGGTTLHELTHALSGTDDVTYGCDADQALTDDQKIKNADNFNCFTTQVFADTKC